AGSPRSDRPCSTTPSLAPKAEGRAGEGCSCCCCCSCLSPLSLQVSAVACEPLVASMHERSVALRCFTPALHGPWHTGRTVWAVAAAPVQRTLPLADTGTTG